MDIIEAAEICNQSVSRDARNDALWLTKRHLEGFRAQKQYVLNLEEDIDDRYEMTNKMIATYDEHIGHSSVEMLHPGAVLAVDEEHQEQRAELVKAKRIAERLEKAISDLPRTERTIIEQRYIEPKPRPWEGIAESVGYDRRWCLRLHSRALRSVAVHLFGLEVVLKQEQERKLKRG
jgi:DNA-directed RNA polymerase specialized sigma subunit